MDNIVPMGHLHDTLHGSSEDPDANHPSPMRMVQDDKEDEDDAHEVHPRVDLRIGVRARNRNFRSRQALEARHDLLHDIINFIQDHLVNVLRFLLVPPFVGLRTREGAEETKTQDEADCILGHANPTMRTNRHLNKKDCDSTNKKVVRAGKGNR